MANLLQLGFFIMTFSTFILGVLVNWFSDKVPSIILKTYRYGKFSYKEKVPFALEVPKRWFRHFYIFSSVWSFGALCLLCFNYLSLDGTVPNPLRQFLGLFQTNTGTVPASVSLLAMALLMVQCIKRFYETHFISVFSDAKMDLCHYLCGLAHYFGAVLAIVCEAPGIVHPGENYKLSYSDLGIRHISFAICFLWACFNQLRCAQILANLRKNKKGEVITTKYKIPAGGYFDLVSSPHQFFEVLMYFSLWMVLLGNETWSIVFAWVLVNQVETAFLSHWWYRATFKEYPQKRKAIIPYLL